jgi:hypothetical protein
MKPTLDELLKLMRENPPVNAHEPWSGRWRGTWILVQPSRYTLAGEAPNLASGTNGTYTISVEDFRSTLRRRRA